MSEIDLKEDLKERYKVTISPHQKLFRLQYHVPAHKLHGSSCDQLVAYLSVSAKGINGSCSIPLFHFPLKRETKEQKFESCNASKRLIVVLHEHLRSFLNEEDVN